MQNIIEEFILQLHTKKDTSSNTEISYKRDLKKFFEYLNIGSIEEIKNSQRKEINFTSVYDLTYSLKRIFFKLLIEKIQVFDKEINIFYRL